MTVARSAGRPPVAVTGHGPPQSTGEQTTTAGEAVPGLWQSGNWRLFWAGGGVSVLGDFVFNVTVMLWVVKVITAGQTWAPAAASGVLIAAAVPAARLARSAVCSSTGGTGSGRCWSPTRLGRP